MTEQEIRESLENYGILSKWDEDLVRYFVHHEKPKRRFIREALANRFTGVMVEVIEATPRPSFDHLRILSVWLVTYAPSDAWGSREVVTAWLKAREEQA